MVSSPTSSSRHTIVSRYLGTRVHPGRCIVDVGILLRHQTSPTQRSHALQSDLAMQHRSRNEAEENYTCCCITTVPSLSKLIRRSRPVPKLVSVGARCSSTLREETTASASCVRTSAYKYGCHLSLLVPLLLNHPSKNRPAPTKATSNPQP